MLKKRIIKQNKKRGGKVNLPDSSSYKREVSLARTRIGTGSIEHMRWILNFAYSNLGNFSEGQKADLGWEMLAFASSLDSKNPQARWDTSLLGLHDSKHLHDLQGSGEQLTTANRLSWFPIQDIHRLLRESLDNFFSGRGWVVTRQPVVERISFNSETKTTMMTMSKPSRQQDIIERFINLAFDLTVENGDHLGRCESSLCRRYFAATRKGRLHFCSPKCSAYVRVARKRGTLVSDLVSKG